MDQQAARRAGTDPGVILGSGRLNGSQGVTPFLKVTGGVRPWKSSSNGKRPDHPISSHRHWRNKGGHVTRRCGVQLLEDDLVSALELLLPRERNQEVWLVSAEAIHWLDWWSAMDTPARSFVLGEVDGARGAEWQFWEGLGHSSWITISADRPRDRFGIASMATMALNSGLWVRRLLSERRPL